MGLVSRGTAAVGLGLGTAVVHPFRSNAVPNPTPNPPPEGALPPGAAGEHSRGGPASVWCDLRAPPLRPRAPAVGPTPWWRRDWAQGKESERVYRSLLPGPVHSSSHSESLFHHP